MSSTLRMLENYVICRPGEHFVSLITKNNPPSKYTKIFPEVVTVKSIDGNKLISCHYCDSKQWAQAFV
jgi:hypothetical protein